MRRGGRRRGPGGRRAGGGEGALSTISLTLSTKRYPQILGKLWDDTERIF